jgi:hypothetical protein
MANCFPFRTLAVAAGLVALAPTGAAAQIMGGWSRTGPAPPPATIALPDTTARQPAIVAGQPEPFPATVSQPLPALSRASTGDAALPVVMFRARPAPSLPPPLPPPPPAMDGERDSVLPAQTVHDETWARLQLGELIVEQPVSRTARRLREPRGPWTRIYQDSRRAIVRDMPEALADSLPWVDRDLKDESLDEVLVRVSDELARARDHDPEWADAAERELRALDARLARLPEPPEGDGGVVGFDQAGMTNPAAGGHVTRNARPFRPRPVWPGATVTAEPQVRPPTLTTDGIEETGPMTSGIATPWRTPDDLADEAATSEAPPTGSRTGPARQGRAGRRP